MNAQDTLSKVAIEWASITDGWCPFEKAQQLAMAVMVLRPTTVLEVGVFAGKSLIPMAIACREVGHGTVIAVDPWSADASKEGYDAANAKWWGDCDHDLIFHKFRTIVAELRLEEIVKIERMKSNDYHPPKNLDIFHCDGQHSEQALTDVKRFAPHVRIGGLVVMDDMSWTMDGIPHVAIAVEQLLKLGFDKISHTKIEGQGEWAFFQRVRAAGR